VPWIREEKGNFLNITEKKASDHAALTKIIDIFTGPQRQRGGGEINLKKRKKW
jgi:hypothetical protein